ncbi:MAG: hypothetical protein PHO41_09090 [Eubacteriales bacterium]|nr:hypothetical protein [Eubacteriales bacterium]
MVKRQIILGLLMLALAIAIVCGILYLTGGKNKNAFKGAQLVTAREACYGSTVYPA